MTAQKVLERYNSSPPGPMLQFRKSTLINAPVKVVWEFYERPDILERLTPPWQPVQIIRHDGGLDVGAVSEFRIWLGPFPVQWVSRHTVCVAYEKFIDEQQVGPMDSWKHEHRFKQEGNQTRLIDAIEFSIPGGWFTNWVLGLWVKSRLEQMFEYRHQVTQDYCQSKGRETN